jgi:H+/Cl- antiporter ClcA
LYVTIYQFIYKKSEIGKLKVVPYTSGKIWSARLIFLFFLAACLNISTVINIKILANYNQQTQSYKFTSHIAAFLSVVLITEMLETCNTNIIWSKRSTDFKELYPCSVWYPLIGITILWIYTSLSWWILKKGQRSMRMLKISLDWILSETILVVC